MKYVMIEFTASDGTKVPQKYVLPDYHQDCRVGQTLFFQISSGSAGDVPNWATQSVTVQED